MNFLIVTHVAHSRNGTDLVAYAPYVNEMNIWIRYVNKVTIIAPLKTLENNQIHQKYHHKNIRFIEVPSFSFINFKEILKSLFLVPYIIFKIIGAMNQSNHIHLRCPGNMGLLGSLAQIFFPNKIKTAKYAGNWDPKSDQPLSYKFQKAILSNPIFSKNIHVLVYGNWENQSKNILPFYTATYTNSEIEKVPIKKLNDTIKFLFVGTLSKGKQPHYAIDLIHELKKLNVNCQLDIYGAGAEWNNLEKIISDRSLSTIVFLKGLSNRDEMKTIYKKSHFLILPSKSEGWPKVVAEAMFWSCLPIATKVSCIPKMLDNGNRGVLLTNDLDKDIIAVKSLIDNENLYNEKVKNAFNWSSNYTLDKFEYDIKSILVKHD